MGSNAVAGTSVAQFLAVARFKLPSNGCVGVVGMTRSRLGSPFESHYLFCLDLQGNDKLN